MCEAAVVPFELAARLWPANTNNSPLAMLPNEGQHKRQRKHTPVNVVLVVDIQKRDMRLLAVHQRQLKSRCMCSTESGEIGKLANPALGASSERNDGRADCHVRDVLEVNVGRGPGRVPLRGLQTTSDSRHNVSAYASKLNAKPAVSFVLHRRQPDGEINRSKHTNALFAAIIFL